ncbi:MAG: hypothetical protein QOF33_1574 [Thermomicrobiales bacterium]|jgi:hypothetical protein|nr:hypothetical protein [Thermomicrobiales bacterium]MEA2583489.1 hypothetical protein [Thermomicrobiales bacterium]
MVGLGGGGPCVLPPHRVARMLDVVAGLMAAGAHGALPYTDGSVAGREPR